MPPGHSHRGDFDRFVEFLQRTEERLGIRPDEGVYILVAARLSPLVLEKFPDKRYALDELLDVDPLP